MMTQEKKSSMGLRWLVPLAIGIAAVVVVAGVLLSPSINKLASFGEATNDGFCGALKRVPPMVLIDEAATLGEQLPEPELAALPYSSISRERVSDETSDALDRIIEVVTSVAKGADPAIAKQQVVDEARILKEEYANNCVS